MKKFSDLQAAMSPAARQLADSQAQALLGELENMAHSPDGTDKGCNFTDAKSPLDDDAYRGLADIAIGRTQDADTALAQLRQRRKDATKIT